MKKRLNYRKLLNNWMQFYSLTAEAANKMFSSIWARVQASRGHMSSEKNGSKGVENNETHMG